ncbi:hypothetical protein M2169_006189 [Streptomyces sp. MJP52]|nr:hypothetical protein [Streptomyces sp. MJP52]
MTPAADFRALSELLTGEAPLDQAQRRFTEPQRRSGSLCWTTMVG